MALKFFILAGEASGDLHGAKLIEALKRLEPGARCIGMGGPKMAAAGLEVAKDLDGMQVVGFWEVAKQYGFFKDVFYKLLDRVKQEKPDALVCIDYPGFNLRFAKEVKKLGIPCLYYIVPQVWAWKPGRAGKMAEYIDRAYCVFEFELPFFDKFRSPTRKMKTHFVGHPLLDQPKVEPIALPPGPKTVGLLPGSRTNEVTALSDLLCHGAFLAREKLEALRALISISAQAADGEDAFASVRIASGLTWFEYYTWFGDRLRVTWPKREKASVIVSEKTFRMPKKSERGNLPFSNDLCNAIFPIESHASVLPASADFSVVKSGTSTLEAGLQGNPLCVVYKGSWASYAIAHLLVDIPVFSLVNIVLGRYAVPELLQDEVNPQRIAAEIERGLTDQKYIETQRAALAELPGKLGGPGASERAAKGMLDFIRGKE